MPHVLQYLPLSHPALSIVCTAGPSIYQTEDAEGICQTKMSRIRELLDAGMRVLRINFSHVPKQDYEKIKCLIAHVRELERQAKQPIPVLMDLKGAEIRIIDILDDHGNSLKDRGSVDIGKDVEIEISIPTDTNTALDARARHRVVVSFEGELYPQMVDGEAVVIGDNEIYLRISEKVQGGVLCVTENLGALKLNKGLNLPDRVKLEAPLVVEEDALALREGFDVDLVAQSFVRSASDVAQLNGVLSETPLKGKPIIVKIETPFAVADIDGILQAPGVFGAMVARGDLGVLADFRKIPQLQERIIESANKLGKPVIVATQMLESMVERPKPWRPEVQDISTAIKEGADALMLSEETAVGNFPREAVTVMAEVIRENPLDRKEYQKKFDGKFAIPNPDRPIDVLGFAICEVAEEAQSPFILSYASTGISATLISRFRPRAPVLAITNRPDTARKLCLPYNVYPVLVNDDPLPRQPQEFIKFLREIVAELGLNRQIKRSGETSSKVFLVGTQELTRLIGGKAQGIFVFEP
ncbi:MAG: pyruvate kinase [Acidobacteriota bacterium]